MFSSFSWFEPLEANQAAGHEVGGHHQVGADVLARGERVLDLGEPLLVVVEVLLVVNGQPGRRPRTRPTNPSAMYSGQLEMRSVSLELWVVPPAAAVSVVVVASAGGEPTSGRARRPPTVTAPRPRKRRRLARSAANWANGSSGCWSGCSVPSHGDSLVCGGSWRRLLGGDRRRGGGSGVVQQFLEVLGGRDLGCGQHQRRVGGPARPHLVAGAEQRQIDVVAERGRRSRSRRPRPATGAPAVPGT